MMTGCDLEEMTRSTILVGAIVFKKLRDVNKEREVQGLPEDVDVSHRTSLEPP